MINNVPLFAQIPKQTFPTFFLSTIPVTIPVLGVPKGCNNKINLTVILFILLFPLPKFSKNISSKIKSVQYVGGWELPDFRGVVEGH